MFSICIVRQKEKKQNNILFSWKIWGKIMGDSDLGSGVFEHKGI